MAKPIFSVPMNYRHAFHAGNHADVLKHIVLLALIEALKRKDTPFFVLDTHAGRGQYLLQGEEAGKTGEALGGIFRLFVLHGLPALVEKVGLKRGSGGPVTEVVTSDVRLDKLPAMTLWPEDGGPFVTLPLVYTQHPDGRGPNLGMYRLHIHDAQTTGMHWQIGKGGGFHYQIAEKKNQALPVTVFLGGPPALILSAIAPLPENVPEMMLASLIAGERLKLSEGAWPHPLVSTAEFALIGEVPPHVRKPEGPFGDHYGYYSLQHPYPVFNVKQIARRRDAMFPATVVGKPRQEDFFIGDLLQELLSPLFPVVMPAVQQLWSYGETGYHALAGAVVKQRYAREAMASECTAGCVHSARRSALPETPIAFTATSSFLSAMRRFDAALVSESYSAA